MEALKKKLEQISPYPDEKQRRLIYAAEAIQFGRGGKAMIHKLTGMSRPTLNQGIKELSSQDSTAIQTNRIRQSGAGRKKQTDNYPDLKSALESLADPVTSGDPESALRWTIKSCRTLSNELKTKGYSIG
jgi:hypothetical protein